jgi:hypothetical protein
MNKPLLAKQLLLKQLCTNCYHRSSNNYCRLKKGGPKQLDIYLLITCDQWKNEKGRPGTDIVWGFIDGRKNPIKLYFDRYDQKSHPGRTYAKNP